MMQAGDIHPKPGPATVSTSRFSSLATVSLAFYFSKPSNHLSVVHYNVHSDLLTTELSKFDILAFTETWSNPSVPTNNLTYHWNTKTDQVIVIEMSKIISTIHDVMTWN